MLTPLQQLATACVGGRILGSHPCHAGSCGTLMIQKDICQAKTSAGQLVRCLTGASLCLQAAWNGQPRARPRGQIDLQARETADDIDLDSSEGRTFHVSQKSVRPCSRLDHVRCPWSEHQPAGLHTLSEGPTDVAQVLVFLCCTPAGSSSSLRTPWCLLACLQSSCRPRLCRSRLCGSAFKKTAPAPRAQLEPSQNLTHSHRGTPPAETHANPLARMSCSTCTCASTS